MYNKVSPVVHSLGVKSKEKYERFIFFIMSVSLTVLVSEIAAMSKLIIVDLGKYY